ncbi:MAG: hypothetical protein HQL26_03475 [Candidatus Omnitrophica bacterium]|nr:hypothetical protein [Candidatus Omnitrophota bacterium]
MKNNFLKLCLVFLLFLSATASIAYWAIAKYNVTEDFRAVNDAKNYIQMSHGHYEGVELRYAKRFLMPEMVGFLNRHLNINSFLSRHYEQVDRKMIQLNFGLINIVFVTLTVFLFYLFCKNLGFAEFESLFAGFLFLTSFHVVTNFMLPLVDSAGCFFVMACLYAIKKEKLFWLALLFLFGVMAKESTFVVVLMILLTENRGKLSKLCACLPGFIGYALIIAPYSSKAGGANVLQILTNFDLLKGAVSDGVHSISVFTLIETVQIFMILWILFVYALVKCDIPVFLKRQSWLMILPFIMPFAVGESSVGRVAFYLFPVLIPIALMGIKKILLDGVERS